MSEPTILQKACRKCGCPFQTVSTVLDLCGVCDMERIREIIAEAAREAAREGMRSFAATKNLGTAQNADAS